MTEFTLDPQLAADTAPIGRLALCEARLMNDQRFPWIILVPMRLSLSELFDLSPAERALMIEEVALAGAAMQRLTGCEKINVGALGNIVRQLHIHVVARRAGDAAWPGPVWGSGVRAPYSDVDAAVLAASLRTALGAQ